MLAGILMPWIAFLFWAQISKPEKTFAQRINKYGERGSPCLKPLDGLKDLPGIPFKRIEKDVVLMHL